MFPASNNLHPNCPFSTKTFEILTQVNHSSAFYRNSLLRNEYRKHVSEPFLSLLKPVVRQVAQIAESQSLKMRSFCPYYRNIEGAKNWEINHCFNEQHNLMGCSLRFHFMNLNDYLQGQCWSGWNSDYPNLFVSIYSEVFVIGLKGLSKNVMLKNIQDNQEEILSIIERFDDNNMVYGCWDKICNSNWTLKDWLKNLKQAGGYAALHLKSKDILDINAENLRDLIGNKLKQLFILILLSTESEPILAIKKYMVSEKLKSNSMKVQKSNYSDLVNLDFNLEDDYVNEGQKSTNKINHNVEQNLNYLALAQEYLDAEKYFSPKSIKEAKERITVSIARRQGQSKFRQRLLEAYSYRCAITGCDAQEALEAAHIIPYIETENNHPSNGILLRADLHTLFDLNLITIDPEMMRIHLAPDLRHTSYRDLHEKPLQLPKNKAYFPKKEALKWRCYHCGWYR
jgi:hypothetical protein